MRLKRVLKKNKRQDICKYDDKELLSTKKKTKYINNKKKMLVSRRILKSMVCFLINIWW